MTTTKKYIGNLTIGDLLYSGQAAYKIVNVKSSEYTVVALDRLGNVDSRYSKNRVSRRNGKHIGGRSYFYPLEEELSEFLAKGNAELKLREEKRAEAEAKWLQKLNQVQAANPNLKPLPFPEFSNLLQVTFVNKAGQKGLLIFECKEDPDTGYDYRTHETFTEVSLYPITAYVPERIGERNEYRMSQPSTRGGRSMVDALIQVIAGHYWE